MTANEDASRPWYREPWPWVIIAIPAAAVIMGFVTLYLAISHPDYLVVEEEHYQQITSELRAQSRTESSPALKNGLESDSKAGSEDGER